MILVYKVKARRGQNMKTKHRDREKERKKKKKGGMEWMAENQKREKNREGNDR